MSTFDLYATCNAMATALEAVTAPSGDALRRAYGQAPNNAPSTPCGIFMPQEGTLTLGAGQYDGTHTIELWFLIEKTSGDFPRIETRRQKWLPILLHVFDSRMALGLSGSAVLKAYPVSWSFQEFDYGGVSYDGIKVTFEVATIEYVSLAA